MGGWRNLLRRFIIVAAEIITLIGTIGFLLAIIICSVLFHRIDINFLQIATPSDVLMTGLQILWFVTPSAMVFLATVTASFYINRIDLARDARRYSTGMGDDWISFLIFVIPSAAAMAIIANMIFDVNWIVLQSLVGLGCGWSLSEMIENRDNARKDKIVLAAGVLSSIGLVVISSYGQLIRSFDYYLFPKQAEFIAEDRTKCGIVKVTWIGERTIVGRCTVDGSTYLVENPQDLVIRIGN